MKEESTAQTSLVKNKWDKKKNCTNIHTNPKLCFLNYRGCRNTSKIPLAIIHLSFVLAAFQVQSPQRFQWNLLTSWVRTMWLYSIKRIQNLILQHLSWKKKKNTSLMRYQCWLIPISVLQQEVPTALPQRKRKTWRVKDDTLRLSRLELFFFSIRCSLIFTPDACELHHWRWNRIMPHEKLYVKPLLGSIISP